MKKKKIILIAISFLVLIGILAACGEKTEEVMIPATFVIVATDAELSAMYMAEPQESDTPSTGIDYMNYIRPIEPLLNGKTWQTPANIDPDDLLMWYATYEHEQNEVGISEYQTTEAVRYRAPRTAVESSVAKYFGRVGDLFDGVDEGVFDPETDEYVLPSQISESPRSICLTRAEEQGKQRNLFFTVTSNQTSKDYLLSLVDDGGSFRYLSLTEQDGIAGDSK